MEKNRGRAGLGRPPGSPNKSTQDIRAICQAIFEKRGGVDAVFARFLQSEDEDIAFKAAQLIAAYGYGKPRETHEITGADGEPIQLEINMVTK